jgi:hypothetical protein
VAIALVTAFRVGYLARRPIALWPDSHDYEQVGAHPLMSSALWTGSRPPLLPLLWHIFGTARALVTMQSCLAAAAWAFLAWRVAASVPGRARGLASGVLVLAFSISPFVLQWDASLLTESLSLSAIASAFAFLLWLVDRVTWPRAMGFVGSIGIFALARDEGAVIALVVGIIIVLLAGVSGMLLRRKDRIRQDSLPHRHLAFGVDARRWALVGLAVFATGLVSSAAAYSSHRNIVNLEDNLSVRIFNYPSRVAWFEAHGMPQARTIDRGERSRTATLPPPTARALQQGRITPPLNHPPLGDRGWMPLTDWVNAHGERTYVQYVVEHPLWAVTAPFGPTTTTVPATLWYYSQGSLVPGWAGLLWIPAPMLGFIGVASFALLWWRRGVDLLVVTLATSALVGLLTAWVAWEGDGIEVNRHMLEGNCIIRIAVLLTFVYAVLGPKLRKTGPDTDSAVQAEMEAGALGCNEVVGPAPQLVR